MKTKLASAFLLALAFSAVTASAQVSASQIDAIFAPLKSSNAPGAAVLVIHNPDIVVLSPLCVFFFYRSAYAASYRCENEFPSGIVHQAVHRCGHHAPRSRRQTALRRPPHRLLS